MLLQNFNKILNFHFQFKENLIDDVIKSRPIDKFKYISIHDCKFNKWLELLKAENQIDLNQLIFELEINHRNFHHTANELIENFNKQYISNTNYLLEQFKSASIDFSSTFYKVIIIIKKNFITLFNINDKTVIWNKSVDIYFKINLDSKVIYCNDQFEEVTGYKDSELVQKSIFNILHPDLPLVIVKKLKLATKNQAIESIVTKNLAKNGNYFWVLNIYKFNFNEENEIISISVTQKGLYNRLVDDYFDPLYKRLLEIEYKNGIKGSSRYLELFLNIRKKTFSQYVEDIIKNKQDLEFDMKKVFFKNINF